MGIGIFLSLSLILFRSWALNTASSLLASNIATPLSDGELGVMYRMTTFIPYASKSGPAQLEEDIKAGELELDQEEVEKLNQVSRPELHYPQWMFEWNTRDRQT